MIVRAKAFFFNSKRTTTDIPKTNSELLCVNIINVILHAFESSRLTGAIKYQKQSKFLQYNIHGQHLNFHRDLFVLGRGREESAVLDQFRKVLTFIYQHLTRFSAPFLRTIEWRTTCKYVFGINATGCCAIQQTIQFLFLS